MKLIHILFQQLYLKEPTRDATTIRGNILSYAVGSINRYIVRKLSKDMPKEILKGHEDMAKLRMSTLLAQCHMLCIELGWNYNQIELLGYEHLKERQEDLIREGWGEEGNLK